MRRTTLALVAMTLSLSLAPLGLAQGHEWPNGRYSPFDHSPIRIHLDFSNLTRESLAYEAEVRVALRYWEEGGNGALQWNVSFVEVEAGEPADIVFWLRDAGRSGPTCDESESAIGCARPFERPVSVEVVMRLSDGTFRPYRLVREVSAHELGHALGLPHSADTRDIMAAHASRAASTSWRPGDVGRIVGGSAALLALGALSVWWLMRTLRRDPRLGAVHYLPPDSVGSFCAESPDGRHLLEERDVEVERALQIWRVCRHCQRGHPA